VTDILGELSWRGLIHQVTDAAGMSELLGSGPQAVYIGFDPTADSLHVGSLMQLMMLRRFQRAGHRPIALVGGATGMIGDPSGKSEERNLLSPEILSANVEGLRRQLQQYLDFTGPQAAQLVNNFDWMGPFSYIDFLRDVGKCVPVGVMLGKDSVRTRLERSDVGMSYTEFSYMLLQAYDFVYLAQHHGCRIQVGGSDQWGNITAGIDLGRRLIGQQLYGLTAPLLLTQDGRKMGKTEQGTIWLSAGRTRPYHFYQYWINMPDAEVLTCLRYLTEIEEDEYRSLEEQVAKQPERRAAQQRLAEWLTQLAHGSAGLQAALRASEVFFGGSLDGLDDQQLDEIFSDVPSQTLPRERLDGEGLSVVEGLRAAGLAATNSDARRAVQDGGVYVNNQRVPSIDHRLTAADLVGSHTVVLRKGKKSYALLRFAE
jgi:tyrosyl-tRNA synthetase